MTGKQREMKGKQRGTQRDMKGTELKTVGAQGERETKHKETNRHDGMRCREMARNARTGHAWKMKPTYRENVRDMKGELKGMEGT